jgi:hypothetical protein
VGGADDQHAHMPTTQGTPRLNICLFIFSVFLLILTRTIRQLAIQVHKLFDGLHSSRTISYTLILQMDAEIRSLLAEAPSYMQFDEKTGNPNPLPANPPAWLEWQRMSYLISSAHKMIILHRPFLGRAFRDPRYQQSREVCVSTAKRILRYLQMCEIEAFRKTWWVAPLFCSPCSLCSFARLADASIDGTKQDCPRTLRRSLRHPHP